MAPKKVSKKKILKKKKPAAKAKLAPKATKKRPAAKKKSKLAKKGKKGPVKKPAAKRSASSKKFAGPKPIGQVTHFFREIKVAIVRFSQPVKQGTPVVFRGATTDFAQKLDSMQYDHKAVVKAPKGKQIGVKVKSRVRQGDCVYSA
jgi:hypothetical protein